MRLHYLPPDPLLSLSFWSLLLLSSSLLSIAMPRVCETSKSSRPRRGHSAGAAGTRGRPARPRQAPIASPSPTASASSSSAIASSASSLVVPPPSNTSLLSGVMVVSQLLELICEEVRRQVAIQSSSLRPHRPLPPSSAPLVPFPATGRSSAFVGEWGRLSIGEYAWTALSFVVVRLLGP